MILKVKNKPQGFQVLMGQLVEQKNKLVERSPLDIVDLATYSEAKRLHSLHQKINPHCERTVFDIYLSILKLASLRAEKDANGRPKILP